MATAIVACADPFDIISLCAAPLHFLLVQFEKFDLGCVCKIRVGTRAHSFFLLLSFHEASLAKTLRAATRRGNG